MNPEIQKKLEFIKKCVETADYLERYSGDEVLNVEIKFKKDYIEVDDWVIKKIFFVDIQEIKIDGLIEILYLDNSGQRRWYRFTPLNYTTNLIDEL